MSSPLSCLPLGRPSLLAFRGPDAERYLNGQLTQDVRGLGEAALPACVTDAKGKLQFFVQVFRGPDDSIWIAGPEDVAEELEARLTRYLIADDVEVENVTELWQGLHAPDAVVPEFPAGGFARSVNRLGEPGWDLWIPASEAFPFSAIPPEEAEARRIAAGIAKWGAELVAGILPPEAGLDRTAISYRKGCYIGQEVLSRIKTAGKVNRKLVLLSVGGGAAVGDRLLVTAAGKEAGTLTSVSSVRDESGSFPALGYLEKAGFAEQEFGIAGKQALVRVLRDL